MRVTWTCTALALGLAGLMVLATVVFVHVDVRAVQGGPAVRVVSGELTRLRSSLAFAVERAEIAEARANKLALASDAAADATSPTSSSPPSDNSSSRELLAALSRAANARREVMLTISNDVMMCSNPKTCWWGGGNVLETFLRALRRLAVRNAVVLSLDDATHAFVQRAGGATSVRMELPVPKAQQVVASPHSHDVLTT